MTALMIHLSDDALSASWTIITVVAVDRQLAGPSVTEQHASAEFAPREIRAAPTRLPVVHVSVSAIRASVAIPMATSDAAMPSDSPFATPRPAVGNAIPMTNVRVLQIMEGVIFVDWGSVFDAILTDLKPAPWGKFAHSQTTPVANINAAAVPETMTARVVVSAWAGPAKSATQRLIRVVGVPLRSAIPRQSNVWNVYRTSTAQIRATTMPVSETGARPAATALKMTQVVEVIGRVKPT